MAKKKKPPRPSDDDRRVQAVRDLKILDSRREARFDRLTREIADALEVPISYVAIIDAERQWLKSKVGDIATEVARDESFCTYTILEEDPLIVADAGGDERFAENPFVTGDPGLRFYAGVPIKDPQGNKVGTVCVADTKPRDMSAAEISVLKSFAARLQRELNAKPSVFISYAHEDVVWKDRLEVHCAVLKRQGLLKVWDDRRIRTGTDWSQEIRLAAERARAAVLLISADFLASDFILGDEIPLLLERREAEGLEIFPLIIKPCGWQHVDWLARMNLRPRDGRPLSTGTEAEIESELVEFASELAQTLAEQGRDLEPSPASSAARQVRKTSAAGPLAGPLKRQPQALDRIAAGSRLGSFEILKVLGSGGMGEVFVARDANLKRKVAVKVLKPEMASDPERLERFQREAETVASLNHPNIVTLFSVEEDRGIRFLTMEFIEGKTLEELVPARGLPIEKIYEIAIPLIEALGTAHNRGIVHRDLKATNVMVSKTGQVKVLDFGLAKLLDKDARRVASASKLTEEGRAVGTFPYMSPEQLEGTAVDARSDIYSLGVLLYEMVTGRMPFESKSATGLVASILRDAPKSVVELRSRLPVSLDGIIQRCLEKDPDKRYQSALDVRDALVRSQNDELVKTNPPGTLKPVAKPARPTSEAVPAPAAAAKKKPVLVGAAAAAALLIAAILWLASGDGESGAADPSAEMVPETVQTPPMAAATPTPDSSAPRARPPGETPEPVAPAPAAEPQSLPPEPATSAPQAQRREPRPPEREPAVPEPRQPARSPAASAPAPVREEPAPRQTAPQSGEPSGAAGPGSPAAADGAPRQQPATGGSPATPPPAAEPQPATPAPQPAPDPKEAILRALDRFAKAYESLDADAVARLWPSAPRDRLAASFAQMKSLEVEIAGCSVRLAGDRATATCSERQKIVDKLGRKPPVAERQVEFQLRRSGDSWLVESRR